MTRGWPIHRTTCQVPSRTSGFEWGLMINDEVCSTLGCERCGECKDWSVIVHPLLLFRSFLQFLHHDSNTHFDWFEYIDRLDWLNLIFLAHTNWFNEFRIFIVEDDTYVRVDELRAFSSQKFPTRPIFIGQNYCSNLTEKKTGKNR